jgi:hypothetical protein
MWNGPSTPFNPNISAVADPSRAAPAVSSAVVVEAELVEKSRNQDLNGTPYVDALHTAVYKVDRVVSGTFDPSADWQAIQWTFKAKTLQPTATTSVGSAIA